MNKTDLRSERGEREGEGEEEGVRKVLKRANDEQNRLTS